MKNTLIVFVLLGSVGTLSAQTVNISFKACPEYSEFEKEVVLLEGQECNAFYKTDTTALARIWSTSVIQPLIPINQIVHVSREIKMMWKASDGSVFATGEEVLAWTSGSDLASQQKVGFTHQWQKQYGAWRLVAKHVFPVKSRR